MSFEFDIEKVTSDFEEFKSKIKLIEANAINKEIILLLQGLTKNIGRCSEQLKKDFSGIILGIVQQVSFIKTYHPTYRIQFVKALMNLCSKNLVPNIVAYESLLHLVTCEDQILRKAIRTFIIKDIQKMNKNSTPVELNKKSKILLQKFITDKIGQTANFAAKIFVSLYLKNIWTDVIAVNVLAECCLHSSDKVKATGLTFFLNKSAEIKKEDDSESETEAARIEKVKKLKLAHRVGKKSQARQKHLDRELNNIKKKNKKKKDKPDTLNLECNVQAIQQLRDPQLFTENLFAKVKKAKINIRVMMLELVSRLIGYHKLQIVNFYSYIIPFLDPKTTDVTKYLVYAVQASHEYVSPDDIQPVVKMIADKFANGVSDEGIAVGLNSIREICFRCPHAMPDDLLPLLIDFRSARDKNAVSATRSLIRLFREINPELLPKNERGRPTEANIDDQIQGDATKLPKTFGALNAVSFVPGAEVLKQIDENKQMDDDEYESCSDVSDDEEMGDWVDVIHSDDDVNEENELKDPAERRRLAEELSYNYIFTDEDHLKIKLHQAKKKENVAKKSGIKKMDNELEIDSDTGEIIDHNTPAEFVTERIITKMSKKQKASKEEKMASIMEGREGRTKFGFNINRFNPNSSTTNREKAKKKNYQMVSYKKKAKKKNLSLREKNKMLKQHIQNKLKFMK